MASGFKSAAQHSQQRRQSAEHKTRREKRAQTSADFRILAVGLLYEYGPLHDGDLRRIMRARMSAKGQRAHLHPTEVIQRMNGLRERGVVQADKTMLTIDQGKTRAVYYYRLTPKGQAEAVSPQ